MAETVTLSLERYENMVEELTALRSFKDRRSFFVQMTFDLSGKKYLTFQTGKEASEFFNDIIVKECKELEDKCNKLCEENERLNLENTIKTHELLDLKIEIEELKRKKSWTW